MKCLALSTLNNTVNTFSNNVMLLINERLEERRVGATSFQISQVLAVLTVIAETKITHIFVSGYRHYFVFNVITSVTSFIYTDSDCT
jgi:hypothetical protein